MKVETLNIWGGRVFEPLAKHLQQQAKDVDVFCFQEVYSTPTGRPYTRDSSPEAEIATVANVRPARADMYEQCTTLLPDFQGFYRSIQRGIDYQGHVDFELYFGLAMFARKEIEIIDEGEVFIYRDKDSGVVGDHATLGRNVQYLHFEHDTKPFTVANMHGLWNGKGKTDSADRLEQSRKAKAFLDAQEGAKILCGDFNLNPDTESLAILEQGMTNLIKEHGVTSTRSDFYEKPGKFADYILVSPEVTVIDFSVLQDQVSDHLPLQLTFA